MTTITTQDVITVIQWLLPSGSLGAVAYWYTQRASRALKKTKEMHDTYKVMYDETRETLIRILDENKKLYAGFRRLEKAVDRASFCRYGATSPDFVALFSLIL